MTTTRILSAALAVQLALVAFTWRPTGASGPEPTPLVSGTSADVQSLSIWGKAGDDTPVTLTRDGQAWHVTTAHDYPADATKVEEVLDTLTSIKLATPIATTAASQEALKVADSNYERRITLKTASGETTVFMSAAKRDTVHVRVSGSDAVYAVNGINLFRIRDSERGYEPAEHVSFDPATITSFSLTRGADTVALDKTDAGWAFEDSTLGALDADAASKLIDDASKVRISEIVGKEITPEMGLDAPAAVVSWTSGTDTESIATSYQIGAKHENAYYVRASTSPYVILAPAYKLDALLGFDSASLRSPEAPPAP